MAIGGIGGALAACWKQFVANPLQMTIICCETLFLLLIMINLTAGYDFVESHPVRYNHSFALTLLSEKLISFMSIELPIGRTLLS